MYNDLPQSQRDTNTERRDRAGTAHVRDYRAATSALVPLNKMGDILLTLHPLCRWLCSILINVYCFPSTAWDVRMCAVKMRRGVSSIKFSQIKMVPHMYLKLCKLMG